MKIEELFNILTINKPSVLIKEKEDEVFDLMPELKSYKGFKQHSIWHQYDVYEHILHVVDNVDDCIELRLAALFHDLGKPETFELDNQGRGHFPGHCEVSQEIFIKFADKHNLPQEITNLVSKLILYHDIRFPKISDKEKENIFNDLGKEGIELLFELEKADLKAQNPDFHHPLLEQLEEQKEEIIGKHK